jgi:excisionase family DNA binding protein
LIAGLENAGPLFPQKINELLKARLRLQEAAEEASHMIRVKVSPKAGEVPSLAESNHETEQPNAISVCIPNAHGKFIVPEREARPSVLVRQPEERAEPNNPKPLAVGKKEAARLLSISERTLFQLVADREIPMIRLKRKVLFRPIDLNAWLLSKSAKQN